MIEKATKVINVQSISSSVEKEIPQSSTKKSLTLNANTQKEKLAQSFDPHDFGKEDGIGTFGISIHLIKSTVGAGILVIPFAMKNLGIVPGTIVIVLVGLIYYHNMHILLATEYKLCKLLHIQRLSFIGVTEKTFQMAAYPINKCGPFMCFLSYIYFSIPVSPASYLIVISSNIQYLAECYEMKLNLYYLITGIVVPFTVFCLINRIYQILIPFSSLANLSAFLMAGILISFSIIYRKANISVNLFGDVMFIPEGFAMLILALRTTGIILPLKNDMKKPEHFSHLLGPLNISGVVIILLYYSFATICYLNYGEDVPGNILSNLPKNNYVSLIVYVMYSLSLSVSYVLTFCACLDCFWSSHLEVMLKDGLHKTILEKTVRIGLNIVAYLLAVAVPQLSLLSTMAGTLGMIIEIALPPLLELLLMMKEKQKHCFTILKNLFLILISILLFFMSTVQCARSVIKLYGTGNQE